MSRGSVRSTASVMTRTDRKRIFSLRQTSATPIDSMSTASAAYCLPRLRFSSVLSTTRSTESSRPTCRWRIGSAASGLSLKSIANTRPLGVDDLVGQQDVALCQAIVQPTGESGRDDPLRLVTKDERLRGASGRLAAGARFDHDESPSVEPALAGDKAGAFDANDAREAIDQPAGFDSQGKHQADVADCLFFLGRTLLGGSLGPFGPRTMAGRVGFGRSLAQAVLCLAHKPISQNRLPHQGTANARETYCEPVSYCRVTADAANGQDAVESATRRQRALSTRFRSNGSDDRESDARGNSEIVICRQHGFQRCRRSLVPR